MQIDASRWGKARAKLAGAEPVAFIGDVHGERMKLAHLLKKLDGRKLVFLGDIIDRGPESAKTLLWIKEMCDAGEAQVVMGNHDWRLRRHLIGRNVKMTKALVQTLKELEEEEVNLDELSKWMETWPIFLETEYWIAVHGGWREECRDNPKLARNICIYGEAEKIKIPPAEDLHNRANLLALSDEWLPKRKYEWRDKYEGEKHIFHGHDPIRGQGPSSHCNSKGAKIMNVDTGACFGHALSAVLFPEFEVVQAG